MKGIFAEDNYSASSLHRECKHVQFFILRLLNVQHFLFSFGFIKYSWRYYLKTSGYVTFKQIT